MEKPWYQKPLRIAALQCNYENGRNLGVIDTWTDMGFNTEQLFHPMADKYSSLFEEAVHGPILREYVAKAQSRRLRIILYLNVHILGPSIQDRADEWAQRRADGSMPLLYDTYPAVCLNSPWREHFMGVLRSLDSYEVDGVFLDGPVIVPGGCHCAHCRGRFREALGHDLASATDEERWQFYKDTRDRFLREGYALWKRIHPEGVYYINLPVTHAQGSYVSIPDALEYNDLVGSEGGFQFYRPPKHAFLYRPGVTARLLEAVAPSKPRVIFMAGDQKPWSWYVHTPEETRLCIATSTANGANIWWGLHGSTRLLDTPGGRAAKEAIQFLAEHEADLDHGSSGATTAVLYSYDTAATYRVSQEETDFYGAAGERRDFLGNASRAFEGVCGALSSSSIPFDALADLPGLAERLARYECVVLPTAACLSEETVAALRRYVGDGGNLVAMFDSSLYTAMGKPQDDFSLADVFGVSFRGFTAYRNWNYLVPSESSGVFAGLDIPYFPAPEFAANVEASDDATVHAWFLGVMEGRYTDLNERTVPAIVEHPYGDGTCYYIAGTWGEMLSSYNPPEYAQILVNAVRSLAPPPVSLSGGPVNVELTVRRQEAQTAVHLVNYAGALERPITSIMPQRGLRLHVKTDRIPATQAIALRENAACPMVATESGISVNVPELLDYEVIILR
jgi:hypothetical protein